MEKQSKELKNPDDFLPFNIAMPLINSLSKKKNSKFTIRGDSNCINITRTYDHDPSKGESDGDGASSAELDKDSLAMTM